MRQNNNKLIIPPVIRHHDLWSVLVNADRPTSNKTMHALAIAVIVSLMLNLGHVIGKPLTDDAVINRELKCLLAIDVLSRIGPIVNKNCFGIHENMNCYCSLSILL